MKKIELELVQKKHVYVDLFSLVAPLTDERCSYDAMIEYVTIKKLKGLTL